MSRTETRAAAASVTRGTALLAAVLLVASAFSPKDPPATARTFTDATAAAGIRFKHNSGAFGKKYLPEK